MGKFQDVLQTEIEGILPLPLLHTCDAYSFRAILENMKLLPQMCDVFNINLLYTYYGIPSYRTNYGLATRNSAYFPICIILDTDKSPKFHKIYPFDSGAFEKKPELKQTFFHHQTDILDFELDASISSAMQVIKTFYQSNDNYIFEKPDINKEFSHFDFEALSYKNLISDETNNEIDSRASSIEIIFNEEITLSKSTVQQIIIPNCFKDDKKISSLINEKLGIDESLGYSTFRGSPKEYFGQIRNEYLDFIKQKK